MTAKHNNEHSTIQLSLKVLNNNQSHSEKWLPTSKFITYLFGMGKMLRTWSKQPCCLNISMKSQFAFKLLVKSIHTQNMLMFGTKQIIFFMRVELITYVACIPIWKCKQNFET